MTIGRWIDIEPIQLYWGDLSPQVKCSICDKHFNAIVETRTQCPNCHAEMTPTIRDNSKFLLSQKAKKMGLIPLMDF